MKIGFSVTGLLFLLFFSEPWAVAIDLHSGYAPVSARNDSVERNAVRVNAEKTEYLFSYKDSAFDVTYAINARDNNVLKGMINVRVTIGETKRLIPIFQGGPIVQDASGPVLFPSDAGDGRTIQLLSHELRGNEAVFFYEEKIKDQVLHRAYHYSIRGKTLIMQATGDIVNSSAAFYCGFDMGKSRMTESPVTFRLPSVPLPVVFVDNQYFLSTYVDPLLSALGRYEITEDTLRGRAIQVGNTPAWLVSNGQGKRPPLEAIAYLTVSDRMLDVIPSCEGDAGKEVNPLRDKAVIDIQQLPLTYRPFLPVETIRRWEAPSDGQVRLEGMFQLQKGESASCNVVLREAKAEKDRMLFSQILDSTIKSAAGMKGNFPVRQGDQLLFSLSGPAVMDGGEVLMDVRMEYEGESYSSYEDFSSQQGAKGWYYEQRIGTERTLMVWNPDLGQWESPFTRSLQTAATLVCRTGTVGDAFEAAKQFFQELRWLGISNQCFLIRDWSSHSRIAPPPDMHHSELAWGTSNRLLELSQQEIGRGNLLTPVVGADQLMHLMPGEGQTGESLTALTSLLQGGIADQCVKALQDYVTGMDSKFHRKGLWLEAPAGLNRIKTPELYYPLLGVSESSTKAAKDFVLRQIKTIREFSGSPLLLEWRDTEMRLDAYAWPLFNGIAPPLFKDSNTLNLVDEEIYLGRKNLRIGFGSYEGFFQGVASGSAVDLRMFPLDQYMTSLLVYGRVPLLSGHVWSSGLSGRDIRKYLLETISLLQPVAREYLDLANEAKSILYQTASEPDREMIAEEVLLRKLAEQANRVTIEYANGLHIHANRSGQPWLVEEEGLPAEQISGDGFLAFNPKTGLLAAIGQQGDRTFSVCRTPKTFFLYSRSGGLARYELFSTDGMVKRWKNPFSDRSDMACLNGTEVNYADPMHPILRSNRRIDCCVEWKSDKQVDLHILQADEGPVLLEFFDAPSIWFENEGKNLMIVCYNEEDEKPKDTPKWYVTASGGTRGVRFVEVHSGERYTITYGARN